MSKRAVFLSGRVRLDLLKNNFNINCWRENSDFIFFISINDDKNEKYNEIIQYLKIEHPNDQTHFQKTETIENFTNYYNIAQSFSKANSTKNALSMFYHHKMNFEMIQKFSEKTNISFKSIIYFRSDIVSDQNYLLFDPQENEVFIPYGNDWLNGVNDQNAQMSMNSGKIYCSVFDNMFHIVSKKECYFHPESLLLYVLNQNNIKIYRFHFGYHLNSNRLNCS